MGGRAQAEREFKGGAGPRGGGIFVAAESNS